MGISRDFTEFCGISLDFVGIILHFVGFLGIFPEKCTRFLGVIYPSIWQTWVGFSWLDSFLRLKWICCKRLEGIDSFLCREFALSSLFREFILRPFFPLLPFIDAGSLKAIPRNKELSWYKVASQIFIIRIHDLEFRIFYQIKIKF